MKNKEEEEEQQQLENDSYKCQCHLPDAESQTIL